MGMYTEVFFREEITNEAARVVEAIRQGVTPEGGYPDHELFRTSRFSMLFGGGSAYFPGESEYRLTPAVEDEYARYGPDADQWSILSLRTSLKNYDGEIEKFFDWIGPHTRADAGGFLGYSLYEEDDTPTLFNRPAAP